MCHGHDTLRSESILVSWNLQISHLINYNSFFLSPHSHLFQLFAVWKKKKYFSFNCYTRSKYNGNLFVVVAIEFKLIISRIRFCTVMLFSRIKLWKLMFRCLFRPSGAVWFGVWNGWSSKLSVCLFARSTASDLRGRDIKIIYVLNVFEHRQRMTRHCLVVETNLN